MNHPSNLGSIRQSKGLIESLESKPLNGLLLVLRSSYDTPSPFDLDRLLHMEPLSLRCFLTPFFRDLLRTLQVVDGMKGGLDEVVRIVRSQRFCQDVLDPCRLSNGPDGSTGNDACSF
jgi:hypothetical protein